MKNIIDICKDFGIEIPADKHADFLKAVAGEYKTNAEHQKKVDRLTADLGAEKEAHKTTMESLKGFEGLGNADDVKRQLDEASRKIKEAEEAAQKKLDERDFDDALKAELDALKFTSTAARKAVEADIRAADLKIKNGKILGLNDLIEQIKKDDASAFVDENQEKLEQNRPRFTQPNDKGGAGGALTKKDIMAIKDDNERYRMIDQNRYLFMKGKN